MYRMRRTDTTRRELLLGTFALAMGAASCSRSADATPLDTIAPSDLAANLASGATPTLLHVGSSYLYGKAHLPRAIHAGETGEETSTLTDVVRALPKDTEIVVYCGCCPWSRCPNVRPANRTLRALGFTRVRALELPTTLRDDWIDRGYPIERAKP